MTPEVGTFHELNLKEGEVVECITSYSKWTVGKHYEAIKIHNKIYLQSDTNPQLSSISTFKRVSPIMDWSKVDSGSFVSIMCSNGSWKNGYTFLYYHKGIDDYREWIVAAYKGDIPQSFKPNMVKFCPPPPVVTEHSGVVYAGDEQRTTTYQTVDGKVDWSTFKVNDK